MSAYRLLGFLLLTGAALTAPVCSQADSYDDFHAFAQMAFGAETEPLVYEWFGNDLEPPYDWWEHVSEASAAVGFATNLPARTYVEYGPDLQYGQQTLISDRPYYQHLHHLTGLTPGTTVHCRVVATDERGNTVYSPDRTIAPRVRARTLRIPGSTPGPPYILDVADAYYLVTEDLEAPGKAFEIAASGVTLDLGGHSVTYNVEHQSISGRLSTFIDTAAFGVRSLRHQRLRILNGRIAQGRGLNGAHARESIGFNPIFLRQVSDLEIAGLILEYGGAQMTGVYLLWPEGSNEIHRNVFVDRGWEITYRHGTGSRALASSGELSSLHTHHNLVKRTRQSGLNGHRIHDNEIYIDSFATNSFGVPSMHHHREGYANKIFGTGYHVVGMGWGNANWWHDNFIHLVGQGPDFRYEEYGNQESLNGFRLTQYADANEELANSIVERNLVVVSGGACSSDGECTQARGLQYSSDPHVVNNVIRENTIKVVVNETVTQAAAIVTQGQPKRCGTERPVRYVGNTLISNVVNVRMGDYYGAGCNHHFLDTQMVRIGDRSDYRTLLFDRPVPTVDHYFYDTTFTGGASYDSIVFTNPGQKISVGWTLDVSVTDGAKPLPRAHVTFEDARGTTIAGGVTYDEGRFAARVLAYKITAAGRTGLIPTVVHVAHGSHEDSATVMLDSPRDVQFVLGDATAAPSQGPSGQLQPKKTPR